MIRIKLSPLKIITFDGEVLEVFDGYDPDTMRVHAGHITSIEVAIDRKGNQRLSITTNGPIAQLPFEPSLTGKVMELIDAVRKAMTDLAW